MVSSKMGGVGAGSVTLEYGKDAQSCVLQQFLVPLLHHRIS